MNQDLNVEFLDNLKTLDPQKNSDFEGGQVISHLFEGLYTQEADGTYAPALATSFDVSPDKLTYTFHLRPDSVWSNGEPVTAHDFVYAWRRLADPKTASSYADFLANMKVKNARSVIDGKISPSELGVSAPDDHTFVVMLDTPIAYLIPMISHSSTYPVPKSVVETLGDAWTKPGNLVGNGAYVLKSNDIGQKIVIARNERYWDNAKTIINSVTFHIINDDNQALTRYLAGELDATRIPAGQFLRLKKDYPDQAFTRPNACTYSYVFNIGEKGPTALKDVRVRKALSYAIDRDIIVNNILQAGQRPAYSWTHWAMSGFRMPDIDFAHWSQAERVAKAKELLAQAGFGPSNPLKIDIAYNTSEGHKKIAVAIQQFWKGVGVNATLSNMEFKVLLDRMREGSFDVARYGWCADYDEASSFLNVFAEKTNYAGYVNERYLQLMNQSTTSADPNADYQKAELLLAEDMPVAPIYFYAGVGLVKPDIRGIPVKSAGASWNAKDVYRVVK
ncbi:peptide ABC transporter substrate-binding protein [Rhizobium sp. SSA_523]|uniref:peptide ABC transporter substrate-binding protein n=1 Tax=Rhizobium sp. SSA_523 TaxID=2952477 RepID=UPI0020916C3B|nr:peptide ABC transporter substrate-binding protein [Rhizobium sp. SSA_523]MCO5732167.1 peptide ABC transporter substrate-binding protein [Rhizobium sp. SSA_523]WKC21418.1 peptide ABC transporter substrate-binding protein [Rhizobium sp. SSA_523]